MIYTNGKVSKEMTSFTNRHVVEGPNEFKIKVRYNDTRNPLNVPNDYSCNTFKLGQYKTCDGTRFVVDRIQDRYKRIRFCLLGSLYLL